jgi:hypothetical protein
VGDEDWEGFSFLASYGVERQQRPLTLWWATGASTR